MKRGGLLFVVSRPSSLMREAEEKRWQPAEDGFWSNERRGMFQRGHDFAALAELGSQSAPGAWLQKPVFASREYSALVAKKS